MTDKRPLTEGQLLDEARKAIAGNHVDKMIDLTQEPNITPVVLKVIADSEPAWEKISLMVAICESPAASDEVLEITLVNEDHEPVIAAINNPAVSNKTIAKFIEHSNEEIRNLARETLIARLA